PSLYPPSNAASPLFSPPYYISLLFPLSAHRPLLFPSSSLFFPHSPRVVIRGGGNYHPPHFPAPPPFLPTPPPPPPSPLPLLFPSPHILLFPSPIPPSGPPFSFPIPPPLPHPYSPYYSPPSLPLHFLS